MKIGKVILQIKSISVRPPKCNFEDSLELMNDITKSNQNLNNMIKLYTNMLYYIRDMRENQSRNEINSKEASLHSSNSNENEKTVCRICLSTSSSIHNPLVAPCFCSGTMKFVHLNCLYNWNRNKSILSENENFILYLWKDIKCELCQEKLRSI